MRSVHQGVTLAMLLLAAIFATAGTLEGRVQIGRPNLDLAGFVVYLEDVETPPAQRNGIVVMDQRGLRFVPHILVIQVGTTVRFDNSDPLAHNVFSISSPKRFNLGLYGRGSTRSLRFDEPGVVQLLCNVHQEMSAYIVVVKSPYFARTEQDGSFRIDNVPPGHHRLRIWHEDIEARSYEIEIAANVLTRKVIRVD